MISYLIFLFIFGGFFGWIIDTLDRSIERKHFTEGSALHFPFLPIYGFGTLIIFLIGKFVPLPPNIFLQGFIIGIVLATLEFFGGIVSYKIFHRRLWTYTSRFNLQGYTDPAHVLFWGMLGLIFMYVIEPNLALLFSLFQ